MLIINLKSEVNLFRSEGSDWLLVVPNRGTDNKVTQGAILDLSKISIAKNEYIFSSFFPIFYILDKAILEIMVSKWWKLKTNFQKLYGLRAKDRQAE